MVFFSTGVAAAGISEDRGRRCRGGELGSRSIGCVLKVELLGDGGGSSGDFPGGVSSADQRKAWLVPGNSCSMSGSKGLSPNLQSFQLFLGIPPSVVLRFSKACLALFFHFVGPPE